MTPRQAVAVLQTHLAIRRGESTTCVLEWELTEAILTMEQFVVTAEAIERNTAHYLDASKQLFARKRQTQE